MPESKKNATELAEENHRLKARAAQLEDRLDHLVAHGPAKALSELEELQRVAFGSISDAVLIADDAGRLTYVSPNVHFIFGHTQKAVEQQGHIGYLLPTTLFSLGELKKRTEINNIECLIRDSVGRARDLMISVKCVHVQGGTILYTCRDVTERKKIETDFERLTLTLDKKVEERTRELRESREQYRRLVEGLQDEYYFYAADASGVLTYISPSVYAILGYTPEQLVGHHWSKFFGDPSRPSYELLEDAARRRYSGLNVHSFQFESNRADGTRCWLEVRDTPVLNEDGRVVASEGIVKDVTAQHEAQAALFKARDELELHVQERTRELSEANERLKASEVRYRSVVEDSPKFIVRWRVDGISTFVNEAFCRYKGATQEELLGSSFMSSIVEEDRQRFKQEIAKLTPENPVVSVEHRVVVSDGRIVWQRWANRALFDDEGRVIEFQSVGSDITEHRRTEQERRDRAVAESQIHHLTPREQDVLRLVVAGDANKVIARKLSLSIKTIEKHRSSLMKKLRVRSVPELVRLAMLAEDETHS